jgi:hypothetical protein
VVEDFPGLGLKTGSSDLVILDSKSLRFLGLSLKTMWASFCQLRHKTDGGTSARDTRRASRSSGLVGVEASLARVFHSGLKTGGDAMMGMHVAPSRRFCRRQAEDGRVDVTGYVEPCYP